MGTKLKNTINFMFGQKRSWVIIAISYPEGLSGVFEVDGDSIGIGDGDWFLSVLDGRVN